MTIHVVAGHGEVGRALATLLSADWVDVGRSSITCETYRFLHVAIPYGAGFERQVLEYRDRFRPEVTVVHTTVPLGTCDALDAVHSPVRGVHPNLLGGLKTFVKFFGGEKAEVAAAAFLHLGVECRCVMSARDTEAMKLWETTQYGVFIRLMQEIAAYCEVHGLDFDLVYRQSNLTYNDGYTELNRPELCRPVLEYMGQGIGGHCVRENARFLAGTEFGGLVAGSLAPRSDIAA